MLVGLPYMLVLLRGFISKHLADASSSAPSSLLELLGSDQAHLRLTAAINIRIHIGDLNVPSLQGKGAG